MKWKSGHLELRFSVSLPTADAMVNKMTGYKSRNGSFCMCGSRGEGAGSPDPLPPEKLQNMIGFLSNTGPDLLKNHKATKPARNIVFVSCRMFLKGYQSWIPSDKTF